MAFHDLLYKYLFNPFSTLIYFDSGWVLRKIAWVRFIRDCIFRFTWVRHVSLKISKRSIAKTQPFATWIDLTLSLLVSSADKLCKLFWTQIRPDMMSGLIWIQTVLDCDVFLKEFFEKVDFEKKKSADNKNKN